MSDTETQEELRALIAKNAAKRAENANMTAKVRAAKQDQAEKDKKADKASYFARFGKDAPVERGRLAEKIDGYRNAESAKNIEARDKRAEDARAHAQRQLVHAGQKMARMRGLLGAI